MALFLQRFEIMKKMFTQNATYLVMIMITIAMVVLGSAVYFLYQTGFEEQRNRLIEMAQSQARLMEAIARFDKSHHGLASFEATLSQIKDAHEHFSGFGETGEFTLAKREGNQIVFLLSHRFYDLTEPHPVDFDGNEAEPMKLALQGKSGSLIGLDYRGENVLAAHEFVEDLSLGIVAKIDLSEVRAPFIHAAWLSAFIAVFFVFLGSWLFQRIGKRMESEVEESERLFQTTFENAAIGLAHVALDGRWLRVNPALCNMLGYGCEKLLKMSFQDVTHPEDLESDLELVQRVLAGGMDTYTMEKRYIKKDSTIVAAELTVALVRDSNGDPDYFISAVDDISKLTESHKELEHTLRFIDTALDAGQDTFFLFDPVEGKAIRWNEAFRDISGYTDEEISKLKAPNSYYSPEDLEKASLVTEQVLNGGVALVELELICKDGTRVPTEYHVARLWNEDEGNAYLVSSGRDVTERKHAEQALHTLNESLKNKNRELQNAMGTIKTISGIVPLCAWCGNTIQNERGEWVRLESYFEDHTDGTISHGMCPECRESVKAENI